VKSTRLSVFCDRVLEMGWMLAVIVTPLFFNVYSSRVFEPDKLTTLRSIAVVMAAVWLVKFLEERLSGRRELDVSWRTPLVLPTLFTVAVYLVSTVFSVVPRVSFFGSYQRLQGTFTTFSYIIVFLVILQGMRTREQLDRLLSVIVLTSLPIAIYGLIQHNKADPLPWGGDVSKRVASNMGNAIFVAAYLIMIVPITLTRIVSTFQSILTDDESGTGDVLRAAIYIFILLAQLITIYFSQSRGPMLGLLGGLGVWALLGTLLLQRAPRGEGPGAAVRLPRSWGQILSYGTVGLLGALLLAGAFLLPGSNQAVAVALNLAGVLLVLAVLLGIVAARAPKRYQKLAGGLSTLVDDLGRALGFLALSGLAAGGAAALLYFATRAILIAAGRAGPLAVIYAAAAMAVVLAAGAWIAGRGKAAGWWMAGIAGLAIILLAVVFLARGQSNPAQLIAIGGGLLAVLAVWLLFIVNQWGWQWMWMSVLVVAVLGAGLFLAINAGGPLHDLARQQPAIGRYTTILSSTGGTARVRSLIWEGALDMILPHEPISYPATTEFPQGRTDASNWLRPLAGYGPESMYVAYNSFYPPLLGHFESRTASPDRSHNETMDSIVITGLLGLAAYVWLFGGILYFGAKWLGLLGSRWQRILFPSLLAVGVLAVLGVVLTAVGPNFAGLSIPVGLVLGMLVFLAVAGFSTHWEKSQQGGLHPRSILLIGILATVVAHLIEINFGIAIASTRTTFWALAGVLVVAGTGLLPTAEASGESEETQDLQNRRSTAAARSRRKGRGRYRKSAKSSARTPSPTLGWLGPVLALGVIGGFMLGTLGFDFITNAERLADPIRIVSRALTILPAQGSRVSYGALLIFGVTWLMGGVLLVPEIRAQEDAKRRRQDQALAYAIYLLVSLAIGYVFALALANRQVSFLVNPGTIEALLGLSDRIASLLTMYYWLVLFALVAGALSLVIGLRLPERVAHPWGWLGIVVLGVAAGAIIIPYNLRPIQADIVYKQADPYDRQGQWHISVQQYTHALDLAPWEDFYHLYLGRALLEYATSIKDDGARDDMMRKTEAVLTEARETNPLNTDHSANLARMYRRWAGLSSDEDRRRELQGLSAHNYGIAATLSPNNALLWNEWSLLSYWDLRDVEEYERVHAQAVEIDPEYEQTWLICGDINRDQGKLDEAIACYQTALELRPDQAQVWRVLADTYIAQQEWPSAIEALSRVVELQPEDKTPDIWSVHSVLSQLYQQLGEHDLALQEAYLAVQLAPQDQITAAQSWLAQLEGVGDTRE